jgi:predicted alpha-1,6-mannanase (GH76 family)
VDPETSRVYDNIRRDGRLGRRCYSYNMGTYVGAAHLLGEEERAREGALFTVNELSEGGILPGHGERGDGGGFNGICLRWISRFAEDRGDAEVYEKWLQKNAQAAWSVRRESDGLSWSKWDEQTPEGERYSWGASSSVMALLVAEPTE